MDQPDPSLPTYRRPDWAPPPNFAVESFGGALPIEGGWPRSPLLVHAPHAATEIPPDVRADILLDDAQLEAELGAMTDWYTDRLATDALERAGVPAVLHRNLLSRLVVDPERFPDDREVMLSRGMGAVYVKTSQLEPLRRTRGPVDPSPHPRPEPRGHEELLHRYFEPYARGFDFAVSKALQHFDRCVIVDVHSYPSIALPYELDPTAARPGVCVGTDGFHTPDDLRDAVVDAFAGVPGGVALDTPFAGTYVPIGCYGTDARVTSVMIEIRRDLYLDEPSTLDPDRFDDLVERLAGLFRTLMPEPWPEARAVPPT